MFDRRLCPRLRGHRGRGVYLDYFNLAFDFDPIRYVGTFGLSPADPGGVKHPLILLLRPLGQALVLLGCDAKQASVLVMAGFGAAGVAIACLFVRAIGAGRAEAAALTTLYAVTGTQLFTSIVAEAYGPAGFGIAALWLLTARRLSDPGLSDPGLSDRHERPWLRYLLGVFCFGVTLTNVMQVALTELLVALRFHAPMDAIRRAIRFGLILTAILIVLCAVVWHDEVATIVADPVGALKQVYWLRTKGERTGALKVVETFLGYSFISPVFDKVHLPEGIDMLDFRRTSFAGIGNVAWFAWLTFLASGAAGALLNARTRWLMAGMAAALALNMLFHVDFQFRGSLYIYASHTHFLVFGLAAGLAPWVRGRPRLAGAYTAAVLVLAGLAGGTNLPVVEAFTRSFDTVTLDCPAPCTER